MKDTKRSPGGLFFLQRGDGGIGQSQSQISGADLYEIKPEIPYTSADLNWMDNESRSTVEMKDPNFRPAIATRVSNMDDYDVVFVGFPIWWYVAPTIVSTFFESYDFSGKDDRAFLYFGRQWHGQDR